MRLYLFGLLRLDEWFSIRANDFLGILYIWKKRWVQHVFMLFPYHAKPNFCHWHIQQGYDWVSADYTNPDVQCMKQKRLITCNIVAWQMVGLLHPHETCCFLRRVVVIFCWYLVSEKKSTNNVRDVTNTTVYSEASYLLAGLPGFLQPQCYKKSTYPTKKTSKNFSGHCWNYTKNTSGVTTDVTQII